MFSTVSYTHLDVYKRQLTACRCIGACGLAPVLTVNDDVYGRLTVDDIDGILEKYAG